MKRFQMVEELLNLFCRFSSPQKGGRQIYSNHTSVLWREVEQGVGLHNLQGPIQPKLFADSVKGQMLEIKPVLLWKLVNLKCPFIGVKDVTFL